MNINQKTESVRKDMKQAEARRERKTARRNGWTDFYTHTAVPFIASMQECFKQEQR